MPDLRPPGWETRTEHGSGVATLHYEDGRIAVEHRCTRQRDGRTLLIAPLLNSPGQPGGHQVVDVDPLTITPSILCSDSGLHGFNAHGTWI